MKISQTVFELQSGHDFVIDRQVSPGQKQCLPILKGGDIINITQYGKSSIIQLTELNFKIWRVTFLKEVFFEPLRNYEIDFSFPEVTDL